MFLSFFIACKVKVLTRLSSWPRNISENVLQWPWTESVSKSTSFSIRRSDKQSLRTVPTPFCSPCQSHHSWSSPHQLLWCCHAIRTDPSFLAILVILAGPLHVPRPRTAYTSHLVRTGPVQTSGTDTYSSSVQHNLRRVYSGFLGRSCGLRYRPG